MSDRAQELLDAESVAAASQTLQVAATPNPVPEPAQPVESQTLAPLGPFLRLIGTASSTVNSGTLTFVIPTGMAPEAGNTLVAAVANVNTGTVARPITVSDGHGGAVWTDTGNSVFGFSATGPSAALFFGQVADIREGDTLTFGFLASTAAKVAVIAEYVPLTTVGTFGKLAGNGTSIDTGAGGFATYEVGTRAVCAAIAYNGTQSLDQAYELVNFERFHLRGREVVGVHTVDLWDYELNTTGAYRVFGTLGATANWAVVSNDWAKDTGRSGPPPPSPA